MVSARNDPLGGAVSAPLPTRNRDAYNKHVVSALFMPRSHERGDVKVKVMPVGIGRRLPPGNSKRAAKHDVG